MQATSRINMKGICRFKTNYFSPLRLLTILLMAISPSAVNAGVKIVEGAVGIIIDAETGQKVGTGFVAETARNVITCWHVIDTRRKYLYGCPPFGPTSQRLPFVPIRAVAAFPRYDLIIMAAETNLTVDPLHFGDFKKFRPGERIIYLGLRPSIGTIEADTAIVDATGIVANDGSIVDFLEFAGAGVPGFSGGPVFDEQGDVIAIMREAWEKKGLKGGNPILINRAFSVDLLKIMYRDVLITPSISTNSTGNISVLLNALEIGTTNNISVEH